MDQGITSSYIRDNQTISANVSKDVLINKTDNDIKSSYLLGPGDILTIKFKDLDIYSSRYVIDPEGYMYLPEIKSFFAKGKTLDELKIELTNKYKDFIYEPNLELYISSYREATIYIKGEVKNPGLYFFASSGEAKKTKSLLETDEVNIVRLTKRNLFEALKLARGVTNNADLSNVEITRINSDSQGGGKIKTNVNLLKMIITGDQSNNLELMDGDVVNVLKSENPIKEQVLAINRTNINPDEIVVYLSGNIAVRGPAILKKGSSLMQAIASSGGKKMLSGSVEFIRFSNDGKTIKRVFRYNEKAEINSYNNPILMDGDIINIRRTLLGNVTEVLKEVSTPVLSSFALIEIFED